VNLTSNKPENIQHFEMLNTAPSNSVESVTMNNLN